MLSRIFVSDGKAKNSFLTLFTKFNELDANPISLLALFIAFFMSLTSIPQEIC